MKVTLCAHCNLPLPIKRRNLGRPRSYHKHCKEAARRKREAALMTLGRQAAKEAGLKVG